MRFKTRQSLRILAIAVPLWVSVAPAVCAAACADHDASSHVSMSAHAHDSVHHPEHPASSEEPDHGVQTCRGDASDLLGSRSAQASAAPQLAMLLATVLPPQFGAAGFAARSTPRPAPAPFARANAPLRC